MSTFSYLITRIFQPENSFAFFFILSGIFCYHHSLQPTFCDDEVCVNFDSKKRYIPLRKTILTMVRPKYSMLIYLLLANTVHILSKAALLTFLEEKRR